MLCETPWISVKYELIRGITKVKILKVPYLCVNVWVYREGGRERESARLSFKGLLNLCTLRALEICTSRLCRRDVTCSCYWSHPSFAFRTALRESHFIFYSVYLHRFGLWKRVILGNGFPASSVFGEFSTPSYCRCLGRSLNPLLGDRF